MSVLQQISLTTGEYQALARIAAEKDTQVHRLIESLVRRALGTTIEPSPRYGQKPRQTRRHRTHTDDDLRKAVADGLVDSQIAALFNISVPVICTDRRRLGLPSNGPRGGRRRSNA